MIEALQTARDDLALLEPRWEALKAFRFTTPYYALPVEQQDALDEQFQHMTGYRAILRGRIRLLEATP